MASGGAAAAIVLIVLIVIIILIFILFFAFRHNRLNQTCSTDAECGNGLICQNNICKLAAGSAGCLQNSDCADGLICNNQRICVQGLQTPPNPEPTPDTNTTDNNSHSSHSSCGCPTDSCSCSSSSSSHHSRSCSSSSSSSSSCPSSSSSSSSSCPSSSSSSRSSHKCPNSSSYSEETRTITDSSFSVFEDNSSYISSDDSSEKFYLYKNKQKFASSKGKVRNIFSHGEHDYVFENDYVKVYHSSGMILRTVQNSHLMRQILHLHGHPALLIGLSKDNKVYYLPESSVNDRFWVWKEYNLPENIGQIINITTCPEENLLGVLYKYRGKQKFATFSNVRGVLQLKYQEELHGDFTHVAINNGADKIIFANKKTGQGRFGPLGKMQKIHHLSKFGPHNEVLHANYNTVYFNTRNGQFSVSRN